MPNTLPRQRWHYKQGVIMKINNPTNLIVTPVTRQDDSNPLSVRGYFDAEPNTKALIDLKYLEDTQGFKGVQCIFIDNSLNDGDVIIESSETGQRVVCKKNMQGYFPLLSPTRAVFTLTQTGTRKLEIPVFFLNFTIAQGTW